MNCDEFKNLINNDIKSKCSNITTFEILFISNDIWSSLSEEEKLIFNPQENIITPSEIQNVLSRIDGYINFRKSKITCFSNEYMGLNLIKEWANLSETERLNWKQKNKLILI